MTPQAAIDILVQCHPLFVAPSPEAKESHSATMTRLATIFVEALPGLNPKEVRAVARCLEEGMMRGSQATMDAIATGFLEVLVTAQFAEVPDIEAVMASLGRRSSSYCQTWKHHLESLTTTAR